MSPELKALIHAAVDGKTIQHRARVTDGRWAIFATPILAAMWLLDEGELAMNYLDFRIKPESVPDKVQFGVVFNERCKSSFHSKLELVAAYSNTINTLGATIVKVTVKTDENGKETKTVEIVE